MIRVDFLSFATAAFFVASGGRHLSEDGYIDVLLKFLADFAEGAIDRQVINIGPRQGKSSLAAVLIA